jgi:peptidyl-prolyl cis-trans isomerase A (cyclophilin A)
MNCDDILRENIGRNYNMNKKLLVLIFSIVVGTLSFALSPGTYATFKTSMGDIVCELYPNQAPNTVANFIGLAKGTKKWTDPRTGKEQTKALYSGTIFHRVIPNFMIQGGDPMGNGRGGPGYRFKDEFHPSLRHSTPGILSMANSGPNTNGSQFFITHRPTPWLDNKHAVFGKVVQGMDIVVKIGNVKQDRRNRPLTDVILKSIEINEVKKGSKGKKSSKKK